MRIKVNSVGRPSLGLLMTLLMAIAALMFAPEVTFGADSSTKKVTADTTLADMSLEELMAVKVTSVSRCPETMWHAAAAVYVITAEDIRRSGLTSIPELLRLAPGMDVAQIDSSKWAISSRGLNDRWARHLLVLIDGRSIYTPLNSGVYWDVRDTLIQDIDRIEIIRGPGAAMWGANAVNGLINIVTKQSDDTQGATATAISGGDDKYIDTIRYGGRFASDGQFRIYVKGMGRNDFDLPNGNNANDGWNQRSAGMRADWNGSANDSYSVQGGLYNGTSTETFFDPSLVYPFGQQVTRPFDVKGGHLLAHWTRQAGPTGKIGLQVYYDGTERTDGNYREIENTMDFDFQHSLSLSAHRSLIYGIGGRLVDSDIQGNFRLSLNPSKIRTHVYSAFLQEEMHSNDDKFSLTIGSKFEHTNYTGLQIQPNIRAQWTPDERRTTWASISRAVRTPSRFEKGGLLTEATFPIGGGKVGAVEVRGDPSVVAETMVAYEVGSRFSPNPKISCDVSAFYNVYDNLTVIEHDQKIFVPHLIIPLTFRSDMYGSTYGLEVSSTAKPTERWKLNGSLSLLRINMKGPENAEFERANTGSPRWQFNLRSYLDLGRDWECDTMLYCVGNLRDGNVPAYTRVDLRFGRKMAKNANFSVGVRNLLSASHLEFTNSRGDNINEVPRSVYTRMDWSL